MVGSRSDFVMRVQDLEVTFAVKRSRRRKSRIAINFEAGDRVLLESPQRTTVAELQAMVTQHERWFAHRLRTLATQSPRYLPPAYRDGELLLHLGQPLELQVCWDSWRRRASVARSGGLLRVQLPVTAPQQTTRGKQAEADVTLGLHAELKNEEQRVRKAVRAWQTKEARGVFRMTLAEAVEPIEWLAEVPIWQLRYMRSQWGSCSESGRLSLNTHLVKLPQALIHSVILHELCHLRHLNHSQAFYDLLAQYDANWKAQQDELGRYAGLLSEY